MDLPLDNKEEDIKLMDINKQRLAVSDLMPQNGLLIELCPTFKKVTFSKSEFLAIMLILDTKYKYPENQNNNLLYLFIDQLNYILIYYFAKSKTIKCNINKFLSN